MSTRQQAQRILDVLLKRFIIKETIDSGFRNGMPREGESRCKRRCRMWVARRGKR